MANIERIEFLKGLAAILYGCGEPGSIDNYVTRLPYSDNTVSLEPEFGSYDFFRTEPDADWNALPNKLAVRLDGGVNVGDRFYGVPCHCSRTSWTRCVARRCTAPPRRQPDGGPLMSFFIRPASIVG